MPIIEASRQPEDSPLARAERQFMGRIAQYENSTLRGIVPERFTTPFAELTAELCSDRHVQFVAEAFGVNHKLVYGRSLARRNNVPASQIDAERSAVLQAFYFVYQDAGFLQIPDQVKQRYFRLGETAKGDDDSAMLARAHNMVDFFNNRMMVRASEKTILIQLRKLYGQRYADLFAQFYRLDRYSNEPKDEKWGAYIHIQEDREGLKQLYAALGAGRLITQELMQLEGVFWANPTMKSSRPSVNDVKAHVYAKNTYHVALQLRNFLDANPGYRAPIADERTVYMLDRKLEGMHLSEALEEYNRTHAEQLQPRHFQRVLREFQHRYIAMILGQPNGLVIAPVVTEGFNSLMRDFSG